jgi:hypothetical protein
MRQLSQLLVLHRRLPDGWKPILHQHFQNVPGVSLVGLLPAWTGRPDRGCVPQQKLMTQLIHQMPKPAKVPRCLSTNTHLPSRQRPVKLLRLPGVAQTPLTILARLLVDKGDLLKPRMKITSYNHHARLLSSRAVGRFPATSLLRSREPTLSCNQFSPTDTRRSGSPLFDRKDANPRGILVTYRLREPIRLRKYHRDLALFGSELAGDLPAVKSAFLTVHGFGRRSCCQGAVALADGDRMFFYPPRITTPALPSTVMDWPLWILWVATPVPSTAGTPYSRATMEL